MRGFEIFLEYSDGDRRRSSAEARSNNSAFQNNRDSFRDNLSREPPRGPKALLDPPSGPRGGGYAGEFSRGRGRGRGRDAMDLTEMREVASENAIETGEIGKATEEGRVRQAEADHRRSEIFETEILH
ncbi:hypothetical protein CGLO_00691 [Colletotrichum gloeosporioides Cg-14]|uniref:Uncharacterized protein n=1 Tax=Colletotrichum gloeosporioides (strain Cg-14) TaxID=1237896 RepID=T0MDF6_COLGC|nr:hypothetical protein CGLO_00691 [Colletotrichum gloeosporioides Cg-14]